MMTVPRLGKNRLMVKQPNLIFRHYCSPDKNKIGGAKSDDDRTRQKIEDQHQSSEDQMKEGKKVDGIPEAPTTCCMTGCPNCVWLEYAEKLTEYFKDGGDKALKEIEIHVTDPNMKSYLLHELRIKNKS